MATGTCSGSPPPVRTTTSSTTCSSPRPTRTRCSRTRSSGADRRFRVGLFSITASGHAGFALGVGRRALDEITGAREHAGAHGRVRDDRHRAALPVRARAARLRAARRPRVRVRGGRGGRRRSAGVRTSPGPILQPRVRAAGHLRHACRDRRGAVRLPLVRVGGAAPGDRPAVPARPARRAASTSTSTTTRSRGTPPHSSPTPRRPELRDQPGGARAPICIEHREHVGDGVPFDAAAVDEAQRGHHRLCDRGRRSAPRRTAHRRGCPTWSPGTRSSRRPPPPGARRSAARRSRPRRPRRRHGPRRAASAGPSIRGGRPRGRRGWRYPSRSPSFQAAMARSKVVRLRPIPRLRRARERADHSSVASQAGKAASESSTTSAPAARSSSAPTGPVATPTARAPADRAACDVGQRVADVDVRTVLPQRLGLLGPVAPADDVVGGEPDVVQAAVRVRSVLGGDHERDAAPGPDGGERVGRAGEQRRPGGPSSA